MGRDTCPLGPKATESFAVGYEIEPKGREQALDMLEGGAAGCPGPMAGLEAQDSYSDVGGPLGAILRASDPPRVLPCVREATFTATFLLEDRWCLVARTMQHVARMETELATLRAQCGALRLGQAESSRRERELNRRLEALERAISPKG